MSTPSTRSRLPFIAGLLALLLFGAVMSWLMLSGDQPPPPRPMAAAIDAGPGELKELKLSDVKGTVEVKGPDGQWHAAKPGDALKPNQGVRTTDGSYAVLVAGEYWEVKMEPGTEVEVGELSSSISKILLGAGMAHARVLGAGKH